MLANMTLERKFIFCNETAYDIALTMAKMEELYSNTAEEAFPYHVLESILATLSDCRFLVCLSTDELMPCPGVGGLLPLDMWLRRYGVVDHQVEYYLNDDIETLSLTESEALATVDEDEECIEDDEEEELCFGVHLIGNLMAETQDLDELYELGHDQDDIMDQFDSFLDE